MAEYDDGDNYGEKYPENREDDYYENDDFPEDIDEYNIEDQIEKEEENEDIIRVRMKNRRRETFRKDDEKELRQITARLKILRNYEEKKFLALNPEITEDPRYQIRLLKQEIEKFELKLKNARKQEVKDGYKKEITRRKGTLKFIEKMSEKKEKLKLPPERRRSPSLSSPESKSSPERRRSPSLSSPERKSSPERRRSPSLSSPERKSPLKITEKFYTDYEKYLPKFREIAKEEIENIFTPKINELKQDNKNNFDSLVKNVKSYLDINNNIISDLKKEKEKRVKEEKEREKIEKERQKENNNRRAEEQKILSEIKKAEKDREDAEKDRDWEEKRRKKHFPEVNKKILAIEKRQLEVDEIQSNDTLRQNKEDERQKKFDEKILFLQTMSDSLTEKIGLEIKNLKPNDNEELKKELTDNIQKILDDYESKIKSFKNQFNDLIPNEVQRKENEIDRRNEEQQRVKNEEERVKEEISRQVEEKYREKNELERIEKEEERQEKEGERQGYIKEWIINERNRMFWEQIRNEESQFQKANFSEYRKMIDDKLKEVNEITQNRDKLTEEWETKIKKLENDLDSLKNNPEEKLNIENQIRSITDEYFNKLKEQQSAFDKETRQREFVIQENLKLLNEKQKKLENIPLKRLDGKDDNFQEPIKTFETYFTDFPSSVDWIEDGKFKNKVIDILNNIDEEGEAGPSTYRNALLDAIDDFKNTEDSIINDKWDKLILKQEKEKFKWETKFNIFRNIFAENNIIVSPSSKNVYDLINGLEETKTPKTDEVNGFKYKGKKIIVRKKDKTFKPNEIPEYFEFLSEIKSLEKNANSIITENLGFYTYAQENKDFSEDYVRNLRERQKELIRETPETGEAFQMEEFNEINTEIGQVRRNERFKFREKVWYKSMGGFVKRITKFLWRFLWFHKKAFFLAMVTIIGAILTSIKYEKTINGFKNTITEGTKRIGKEVTKQIKEILKQLGAYGWIGVISASLGFARSTFLKFILWFLGFSVSFYRLFLLLTTGSFLSLAGIFYFIIDFIIKRYGFILTMFSYYLSGKQPTEKEIEYLAKEKNMEVTEFKEYYLDKENFYNNTFATASSYPMKIIGYILLNGADLLTHIIDMMVSAAKYITIFFLILIVLYIINRWRN